MEPTEMMLLIIIIICSLVFIIGPSSRCSSELLKYDDLIKLAAEGKIKLKISNHRIAQEIATSSIYPQSKFKIYRIKACIFRVIFLVYIATLWLTSTAGPVAIILALTIRAVSLRNLSDEVTGVALKNKKVYEAISSIDGWTYEKMRDQP